MTSVCAHALSTELLYGPNVTHDRSEIGAVSLLRFLERIGEIMGDLRNRPFKTSKLSRYSSISQPRMVFLYREIGEAHVYVIAC